MNVLSSELELEELLCKLQETERQLEEKNQQLELINQVGNLLVSGLEVEKVVQHVTDIATKVSKAQFGALFYKNNVQGEDDFQLFALSGANSEHFAHLPKLHATPLLSPTFTGEKKVIRSHDITLDPRYGQKAPHRGIPHGHLPIRSYMAMPVISMSGEVLGALFFGHAQAGVFTQEEENIVLSIAAQAAIAIDNARLHEAKLQAEQQKSLRQINTVLASITDGFFTVDKNMVVTYWNKEAERVTNIKRHDILHRNLWDVFDKKELPKLYSGLQKSMSKGKTLHFRKFLSPFWLDISTYPSAEGASVYLRDVTQRHREEQLEHLKKEVLELNTKGNSSLEQLLTHYLEELEKIHPFIWTSVKVIKGDKLYHLVAPSLPASYTDTFNGIAISPDGHSCGAAVHFRKKIIVDDIAHNKQWKDCLEEALKYKLKACWSIPLTGSNQKMLGTFAIYFQEAKSPTPEENAWFESAGRLLQVIMESKLNEAALRISNDRYNLATAAVNDAIWDWDLLAGEIYRGAGFEKIFGYTNFEESTSTDYWVSLIHPQDMEQVIRTMSYCLEDETTEHWQLEYRYQKSNGEYAHILDQAFIVRNEEGEAIRVVGAMQDISERKRFEAEREFLIEELKQNNSDLRQFSYITTHNLRSPLSNLMAITKLIKVDSISDVMSRKLVEKFTECTYKLNDTLNDLLDILVIRNGMAIKKEMVSLDKIWQEVTSSLNTVIQESEAVLQVDFSGGELVWANPGYLHSIFQNLLTNSLKYRSLDRGLEVKVTTKMTPQSLEICFSDNGLGIDLKRYGDRLFGLYQRFHHHDNSKGIGLYITQSQIKAMEGNITVKSKVDKGTTFYIQFKQPQTI